MYLFVQTYAIPLALVSDFMNLEVCIFSAFITEPCIGGNDCIATLEG